VAITSCKICKTEFHVKPSWLKKGQGKYCSRKCQFKAQEKGKFIFCGICRKKAWRMPKQLKHSKSGKFFCSKSCQTLWRNRVYSGPNHPFWMGGIRIYRKIMAENGIKQVCAGCSMEDTRVLIVHHRDKNRKNNAIENLRWLCRNCHYLTHRERGEVIP
jgi:hypothetical protein